MTSVEIRRHDRKVAGERLLIAWGVAIVPNTLDAYGVELNGGWLILRLVLSVDFTIALVAWIVAAHSSLATSLVLQRPGCSEDGGCGDGSISIARASRFAMTWASISYLLLRLPQLRRASAAAAPTRSCARNDA